MGTGPQRPQTSAKASLRGHIAAFEDPSFRISPAGSLEYSRPDYHHSPRAVTLPEWLGLA